MTPPTFGHGSLRLVVLSLLSEHPMHGYEIMQALTERFGGTYTPSAGTIYPRLAKLTEEGMVTKITDGRKSTYSITDAGRKELLQRQHELDSIENDMADSVRQLADSLRNEVNHAMKSMKADLAMAAQEARIDARKNKTAFTPTSSPLGDADPRAIARQALRDADVVLSTFRQELRADLRAHAARGKLATGVVENLRRQLGEVRASINRELKK